MEGYNPSAELYGLFVWHDAEETVTVGSLGEVHWPEGWTIYVGRASYGWSSRLKRFAGPGAPSNHHWHVDYLVDQPTSRLRMVVPVSAPADRECDLAGWFADRDELRVLEKGFGASDCTASCGAHAFTSSAPARTSLDPLLDSRFDVPAVVTMDRRTCEWVPRLP